MEKEKLIPLVYLAVPYPHLISKLDITSEQTAIRFDWRGTRYRVGKNLGVDEVKGGMLGGTDVAILMQALLEQVSKEAGLSS